MTQEQLAAAMEAHGDMVYRLALCRLQNHADAEDVYQDVFLRLYGQRTESWDEARTAAAGGEPPEVWAAVAALPEKLRTAVHLHYGEGYTAEEIAAMLRIPAVTVRTRLYRGRQRLRELLGGDL